MKKKEIKKYIQENHDKFPLSYHLNLSVREHNTKMVGKVIESLKFNDKGYIIKPFYKSISRF